MSRNLYAVLSKLTDIAVALSAEKDKKKLFKLILTGARELTHADGVTFYLVEGENLRFEIVQNETLKLSMVGEGVSNFMKLDWSRHGL